MRIILVGVGYVGQTALRSLYGSHECTVVDVRRSRLEAMSQAYDVRVVSGSGARAEVLAEAGIEQADLLLACTSRDEINLLAAMLARRQSRARTVVRTTVDYVPAWRSGALDVDSVVSYELETANAVNRVLGVPGARHVDFFADGDLQVLAFDVGDQVPDPLASTPLARAPLPDGSTVAAVIRNGRPRDRPADETVEPRDRLIVIASRAAAREWSRMFSAAEPARDVVVFGGGRTGKAIAEVLLGRGLQVRLIEADPQRAREVAESLPGARVYEATGFDPEFLRRERIGAARAAVFAMGDDSKNLHAAVLARTQGAPFTVAVIREPGADEVFDAAGVDATINPADETAQLMVRFAAGSHTRGLAMIADDRFEVLDVDVRDASAVLARPLAELAGPTTVVGAIVRDGEVAFPRAEPELRAGDRALVLAESRNVAAVERAV
jgi:trk system potassium uptake protein TrkA